jgi:hypothetical protein
MLELPENIPELTIPLLVGMYDLITRDRMTVTGGDTDFIHLTDITIEAS